MKLIDVIYDHHEMTETSIHSIITALGRHVVRITDETGCITAQYRFEFNKEMLN